MNSSGKIIKVSGPLIVAKGLPDAKMYDVVKVSEKKLIGEIIEIRSEDVYIQVYEDTSGIGVGEPVWTTGKPLSVELGPGLINSIYDGIQRPLDKIFDTYGHFIQRGIEIAGLDRTKKWTFNPKVKVGDLVSGGDILGEVQETTLVVHKVLVPPNIQGKITKIFSGEFTVEDTIAELTFFSDGEKRGTHTKCESSKEKPMLNEDKKVKLKMYHTWPVRQPRPYREKLAPKIPLFTGQRIIDTLFPVAQGGTACVPGPFGSGKTVIQHQLAKWSDTEIIVYVGCGERGNEMTDVLIEFPQLKDPKSGQPLMLRTVLIANTSNMPVAAREASIYTGITIAEYFRDMGYSVALQADSTSRWAEALREISGRLEEMPGEEGYPAYLPKRLAEFYERSGRVICIESESKESGSVGGSIEASHREGSLSVIGAVSPPGGDLSDPVVQGTLKVVKVFWSLEDWLAHARHFPAINWLTSYSQYHDELKEFFSTHIGEDWTELRIETMQLLQKESELKEIVRLVGLDALSEQDKLVLESARSIREDFLYQSAFDPIDTYASGRKQYLMLKVVIDFYREAKNALMRGVELDKILSLPIREEISQMRFTPEKELQKIVTLNEKLRQQLNAL
ncbi:MAG: V-type ATP synthase subunit A [Elusimicrobiota bacterium]|nr:V-type ATP synthase subunit A [Elusimicrobiota bacterium]